MRPDDLQFLEHAACVERVLSDKGYTRTHNALEAEMAVSLDYDLDFSQHAYAYSTPVYGQTGGGTANFSANTYGTYGNYHTTGTVTQQPTFGVVGSELRTGTVTVAHRYVRIAGYDVASQNGQPKLTPRWETKISSSGSSGDMRQVFPALIAAASDHIATNTKKEVRVTLDEKDPRINWVRGRSPKPRR